MICSIIEIYPNDIVLQMIGTCFLYKIVSRNNLNTIDLVIKQYLISNVKKELRLIQPDQFIKWNCALNKFDMLKKII
jgi:hypothetical protein